MRNPQFDISGKKPITWIHDNDFPFVRFCAIHNFKQSAKATFMEIAFKIIMFK